MELHLSCTNHCHDLVHSGRYSGSPSWFSGPGDVWASSSGLLICHAVFIIALPPGPLWEVFRVTLMTPWSRWCMGQQQWTAYLPCRVHHSPATWSTLGGIQGHPHDSLVQVMYGPAAVDCLSAMQSSSLPHLVHSGRYSGSPSWLSGPGDVWASSSGLLICHAEFIIALPPGPLWEVFRVTLMTLWSRWCMGGPPTVDCLSAMQSSSLPCHDCESSQSILALQRSSISYAGSEICSFDLF